MQHACETGKEQRLCLEDGQRSDLELLDTGSVWNSQGKAGGTQSNLQAIAMVQSEFHHCVTSIPQKKRAQSTALNYL